MLHILSMTFLGLIAGMMAGLWTRLIRKNMIFRRFGKYLETTNNNHLINYNRDAPLVKFVQCIFCVAPWFVFVLEILYMIRFHPWWPYCFVGILGGLGAANMIAEFINAFRNEP
jgi:hypothetical protein